MALWALLTDTIESLAAMLLVDEHAMYRSASEAILGKRPSSDGALRSRGMLWNGTLSG